MNRRTVTCLHCGWVLVAYSRAEVEAELASFLRYFDGLSPAQRQELYGNNRPTISQYEHCFACGNSYQNFRPSQEGDCPRGVTLQTIIQDDEEPA